MQQQRQTKAEFQEYVDLKKKKMKFEVKPEVVALTVKPKFMYPLFNLFELQVNRFANLEQFKNLAAEIISFNQELDDWKKKNKEIKNLYLTYHLYQNLFSRMKFVSNLVIDRGQGRRAYKEIIQWFTEQKPKIRNCAPEKEQPHMKPSLEDKQDQQNIDSLLASNINKRELKVYEAMSRTAHAEFFPPKERLMEYKRKDIVAFTADTQRRAMSVSSLNKMHTLARYRGSLASTGTSFKKTTTTDTKKQKLGTDPLVVPFVTTEQNEKSPKPQQILQQREIQQLQKEKQVQQQQILQKNIAQVVNEEDYQDGEEGEEVFEEEGNDKTFKKYKFDPSADKHMIAEQLVKDAKQSTLRRILKQKEEKIRSKLEELNLAQQMGNWAAVKGNQTSHQHGKLERQLLVNRYKQLQYVPKTFQERQNSRKKDIPEYPIMLRSKSSNQPFVEHQIQKLKINSALKTYGRYIQHVEIRPVIPETEEQKEEMRIMRSTSLTSFCKQDKKPAFSKVIDMFATARFNEDAREQMVTIKDRLSKKMIPVQNQQIYSALHVVDLTQLQPLDPKQIYPPKSNLLSNPFFPKHLYTNKPKKKKK